MVAVVVILYLAHLARYTRAMSFVKQAAASDLVVTDRLLRQIHDENPSFWPHGLSRAHFDGGLYLLSKQAGMEPVGFVGWQERHEQGRRVGYYSIGILPEHRRKEYAKRAVQAVLTEKSAGVDEVRAMVASHNEPSKQLAHSLEGVTLLEKEASKGSVLKTLLSGAAGGTSTMLMQDNMMHPDEPMGTQAFNLGENGKSRNLINLVNFALGAAGGGAVYRGVRHASKAVDPLEFAKGMGIAGAGATGMIAGPIAKDALMDSHKAVAGIDRLSKDLPTALVNAKPDAFKIPNSLVTGGIALGAAGIGTAALISILKMKERRREAEAARGGRIRVTLPTKNPGDSETTIDLPTEGFDMSAALQGKLKRDTRQRLLLETRQRTRHRKPVDPDNLTEAELERIALDQEQAELDAQYGKSASLGRVGYFRKQAFLQTLSQSAQNTAPELLINAGATLASHLITEEGNFAKDHFSNLKRLSRNPENGPEIARQIIRWGSVFSNPAEARMADALHSGNMSGEQSQMLQRLLGRGQKISGLIATAGKVGRIAFPAAALAALAQSFRDNSIGRQNLAILSKQAGAAPAVPSPPAQGTNPALRMTAEAQAAQQAAQGAATEGNPQIAAAQQAASAAEQKAQQDVAAAQQATQQESMQRDQAHQQELAKKDQETFQARQEIEIQKTQVEKAKVEMELAKAKMEAAKEIDDSKKSLSQGDDSAVARMTKQRLARIKNRLSKVAAFTQSNTGVNSSTDVRDDSVYYQMGGLRQNPSFTPPTTPAGYMDANRSQQAQISNDWGYVRPAYNHVSAPPAGPLQLRPDTAQRINDNGNEFQAYGGLVRPHIYRNSYGKLGDTAYGNLVRPFLMTPSRDDSADWANLSPETMAASPDAFDAMLRAGQTVLNTPR